jgi:hypothetical protein
MNKKSENSRIFRCEICNKIYASNSSLCNHNKKFHNKSMISHNKPMISQNISQNKPNENHDEIEQYKCKYCNNKYNHYQSRWKHEKTCKKNNNQLISITKEQFLELQHKNAILEKKIENLEKKNNNTNITNINNTNQGTINNNIIHIVKFGNLDYDKIFNDKEIRNILNHQYMSLEESIKRVHFNDEHPEYNNIFITNLKDDIAYIFNGEDFIVLDKNEVLSNLVDLHQNEINISLEKHKKKLNFNVARRLEDFLDKLNDENRKFKDVENNKIYNNYKAYKIHSIKKIIYNKSKKNKLDLYKNSDLHEKVYTLSDVSSTDETED